MSGPRYSEAEARQAIADSRSWAESLRRLGMCASGGSWRVLKRYALDVWMIPVDHFDSRAAHRAGLLPSPPLADVLIEHSTYNRQSLKRRLYAEGLLARRCLLCGQGEEWQGRRMALILDHINGVRDDNRLANLRIVCPNCAATLDTHCGRGARTLPAVRFCERCGAGYAPSYGRQRFCSRACGVRYPRPGRGAPRPETRKVERPPHEQLLAELEASSYSAVGRRYGVSDNAVRKWMRAYEREAALTPGAGPRRAGAAPPGRRPGRA